MTQSTEQLLRMALIVYLMIGAVIAGSMTGSVARSFTTATDMPLLCVDRHGSTRSSQDPGQPLVQIVEFR